MSSSFVSQIMQPGGGVMLLPFVRFVIGLLLVLTIAGAIVNFARIHMIILAFLSGGLLVSLSFFESEFKKVRSSREGNTSTTTTNTSTTTGKASSNKTD